MKLKVAAFATLGVFLGFLAGIISGYILGILFGPYLPQFGRGMEYENVMTYMFILGFIGSLIGLFLSLRKSYGKRNNIVDQKR